jgi:hypothetical protein
MTYSIIVGTSQVLTGAHGDGEGQKATDAEHKIEKIEHDRLLSQIPPQYACCSC